MGPRPLRRTPSHEVLDVDIECLRDLPQPHQRWALLVGHHVPEVRTRHGGVIRKIRERPVLRFGELADARSHPAVKQVAFRRRHEDDATDGPS